jgi:hypothetical protein
MARAECSGAGAFRVRPLGGGSRRQGAASVRARCRADGGPDMAWQPSCARGQSSGTGVSAAALTGPRAAALTGTQFRPLVREPVLAWTPRRHCLGGVSHDGAGDDGGVGFCLAPPHDPAASALCRLGRCLRCALGSLGHRSGAGSAIEIMLWFDMIHCDNQHHACSDMAAL